MLDCSQVHPLVAGYLDGELSEAQAAPMRQHLLACSRCRQVVQGQEALKHWFVPGPAVSVPDGFAVRVARRAFQGDRGLLTPVAPSADAERRALLRFVVNLCAVAAAALLIVSMARQLGKQPESRTLRAESVSLDQALQDLDRLNRDDRLAAPRGGNRPGSERR